MDRAFKTRTFNRWLRKSGLSDQDLIEAIKEMQRGLIDADLGGHVVKKRVALPGRGKRGSARTLVGTNYNDRWIFLFGFGKSERDNITANELAVLQEVAKDLLALDHQQLETAIADGELLEMHYDHQA